MKINTYKVNTLPDGAEKLAFDLYNWANPFTVITTDKKTYIIIDRESSELYPVKAASSLDAARQYFDLLEGMTMVYVEDKENGGWIPTGERVIAHELVEFEEIEADWTIVG